MTSERTAIATAFTSTNARLRYNWGFHRWLA